MVFSLLFQDTLFSKVDCFSMLGDPESVGHKHRPSHEDDVVQRSTRFPFSTTFFLPFLPSRSVLKLPSNLSCCFFNLEKLY